MKTDIHALKYSKDITTSQSWKRSTCFNVFSIGLPRGEGPGPVLARANGNTASGHAPAPEIARGSHHGLTQVKDAPESEKRSGRRKDCLLYDPKLSVVSGSHCVRIFSKQFAVGAFLTSNYFSLLLYPVCSTTLWVGQVDKKATQQDLTNLFEEFGQIESINVRRPLPLITLWFSYSVLASFLIFGELK